MKVIVILDDNLGMLFNNRRQSRDRVLIDDIIKTVKEGEKPKRRRKMTKATQLEIKIEELNEIEKMMEELKAEADAIKDELKSEMSIRGLDQMEVGQYIVRWTSVLSSRFV